MKEIQLTKGKVAIVDDGDYDVLSQWKWQAHAAKGDLFYAFRSISYRNANGQRSRGRILMHRFLLNVTDRKVHVDHIDHNGLNNQRHNLRTCSNRENHRNRRSRSGSTSKYLGVCWHKHQQRWVAQIGIDGKIKCLGYFESELDAAITYNAAAKAHFGEFANLNEV